MWDKQMVLDTSEFKQKGKSYTRLPVGYPLENTCPVPGPVLIICYIFIRMLDRTFSAVLTLAIGVQS